MQIEKSVALIYGGTSGIGKALAMALLDRGANVIYTGSSLEKGEDMAKSIRTERAVFHHCDITDWDKQEECYEHARQAFGKSVDMVVVIAGVLDSSDLMNDHETDGTYHTIQVNITACVKANRLAIQHFLREGKQGCIINTSSIYGLYGAPLAPMYSASKHAIIGLTRSYGLLLRGTDIRVNCIAPSFIETSMLSGAAKVTAAAIGYIPMETCIRGYLRLIEDDGLNGDILSIKSGDGMLLEPKNLNDFEVKLTELSTRRTDTRVSEMKAYFEVK
ncbi:NAD(P)-binding protein [Hesseltinella vesiculosa]|uniref:NAD(P)-binding protein n=1 Tax=Hesseltinella vesiculosa TaxID=101127 RepID=A0A1X2GGM9_9FUNG|nr:NAD(P)-binding protein [Hesseltinella vesiculosa]